MHKVKCVGFFSQYCSKLLPPGNITIMVSGTFVLKTIRSHDGTFVL